MIYKRPEKKILDYAKSVQNDKSATLGLPILKRIINVKFQNKFREKAKKNKSLNAHEHCNK